MSVSREEKVSAIITEWIETMNYLTGPDKLPMLEAVSKHSIEGICVGSIKANVQNAKYSSLLEFIVEFEKLLKHERSVLNSTKNSEIETIKEIDQLSEESLDQVLAIYKIYILEEYLFDWISKTQAKLENNTTTIDKLYETIIRGKVSTTIQPPAPQKRKQLPEEKPQRTSKRLSLIKQKLGTEAEYTSQESEPTSSQDTMYDLSEDENVDIDSLPETNTNFTIKTRDSNESEDRPSVQQLEQLTIQPVSQVTGFDKKHAKAIVHVSPMNKRVLERGGKGNLDQKKKKIELPSSQDSPLTDELCICQVESDTSQTITTTTKLPHTLKKTNRFKNGKLCLTKKYSHKRYNKTRENLNNNNNTITNQDTDEENIETNNNDNNNNNNDNNNNNNNNITNTEEQQNIEGETEPLAFLNTEYVITKPADDQSLRITVEKTTNFKNNTSPISRPTSSVKFFNTRGSVTPDYKLPQLFPRYPYGSCPSASSSPFFGFYSRQKIPSFRHRCPYQPDSPHF